MSAGATTLTVDPVALRAAAGALTRSAAGVRETAAVVRRVLTGATAPLQGCGAPLAERWRACLDAADGADGALDRLGAALRVLADGYDVLEAAPPSPPTVAPGRRAL